MFCTKLQFPTEPPEVIQDSRSGFIGTIRSLITNLSTLEWDDGYIRLNPQFMYDIFESAVKYVERLTMREFLGLFKDEAINPFGYACIDSFDYLLSLDGALGEDVLLALHNSINSLWEGFFYRLILISEILARTTGVPNVYSDFAKSKGFSCYHAG